jgi:cell division initiation protein
MPLTALDISKQDFSTSLRGYNREEVRAFLNLVAKELETLQQSESRLAEKVSQLEDKLREFQDIEQTLRDALLSAQEAAKQAQKGSERERELIINNAKIEAENIRKQAHEDWSKLQSELHQLRAQKKSFIKRLKYILQSQQELIELLESDDEGPKRSVPKIELAREKQSDDSGAD